MVQSATSHPLIHAPDFWPALLYRLSNGLTPIPTTSSVNLQEQHACAPGALTAAAPWTIAWTAASVTLNRSDCFSSADLTGASMHDRRITEDAAIGAALCALADLCAGNQVSYVAQIGTRVDYYLNGSNSEAIEIGGTNDPRLSLPTLREQKSTQALQGTATICWICVVHFDRRELILERVR